jgi:hypothetical protein
VNPDVVAEVIQQDGKWRFVNFHDPSDGYDLLGVLKNLKRSREGVQQ